MPVPRAQFVAAVVATVGTPFLHRGRIPGVGLDCVGVPISALRQCGATISDTNAYGEIPSGLLERVGELCDPIDVAERAEGDIVLARMHGGVPMHLAVLADVGDDPTDDRIVHATSKIGRVVTHRLGRTLRVHSYWRPKEIV